MTTTKSLLKNDYINIGFQY